ncbi:MAG: hypothetical protein FADNKDHG_01600 [Holosporales bacterium]
MKNQKETLKQKTKVAFYNWLQAKNEKNAHALLLTLRPLIPFLTSKDKTLPDVYEDCIQEALAVAMPCVSKDEELYESFLNFVQRMVCKRKIRNHLEIKQNLFKEDFLTSVY